MIEGVVILLYSGGVEDIEITLPTPNFSMFNTWNEPAILQSLSSKIMSNLSGF
jgi:hypothetical protein